MKMEVEERKDLEYSRIKSLNQLDLDYKRLQEEFRNLVELAASIAGTRISLINLIDNHTQWTVASNSTELFQVDKEESVCYRTIRGDSYLEISRLDEDERFRDKPYVKGKDGLTYYLGIPLKIEGGANIGALCVVDREEKRISEEKKELLKLIAREIMEKLAAKRKINSLQVKLSKEAVKRNQLAHDIRGPLAGIQGIAELAELECNDENQREYLSMINSAASGLMNLTEDILNKYKNELAEKQFSLSKLRDRLIDLYEPTAIRKKIKLMVLHNKAQDSVKFPRKKLLPIIGNIIANSIKFTDEGGEVKVNLDVIETNQSSRLFIQVTDNGRGISPEKLRKMESLESEDSMGTNGELGYGLGLRLVREMVAELNGNFDIQSIEKEGTKVRIEIPLL
ncbi:GAF domain-containing sensor histidine kinase [Gramella sp. BOM4]|nr:GAF domain-containing sensor histidine kinase [Christiangramia bathymodioli]